MPFDEFPLEILFSVFRYLDIRDILRIRKVSRYLNEVSYCREVWTDAYRNAEFVRPPGPFLSQSAHDLECVLVPSFRVDCYLRRWRDTSQSGRPAPKLRDIRYTGVALYVGFVLGRFLLIALRDEVRCYDLNLESFDGNSGFSIAYKSTSGTLKSFRCVSAIDVEGRQFTCVVLTEAVQGGKSTQISIYSMSLAEHSKSEVNLDLLHQIEYSALNVVSIDLGPRVIIIQGAMGPGYDWHVIVFDVHARTQFFLPSLTSMALGISGTESRPISAYTCISTSTHLVLARSFDTLIGEPITVFQAFSLSNLQARPATLCLSHRGFVHGTVRSIVLLHDAIVDPSTQDALIIVQLELVRPSTPFSGYGSFRLAKSDHDGEIGTITFQPLGPLGRRTRTTITHPSFNGTGRVFYTFGILEAIEYDIRGNGRGDDDAPVAKFVEYPSVLRFSTPRMVLDYDPYFGRICLRSAVSKETMIEVVDLVV